MAKTYKPPPLYSSHQTQYHTQPIEVYQPYQHYQSNTPINQQLIQLPPLQSYAPTIVQQPPTIQPDTKFVTPTFLPTDDPIESLKKIYLFAQVTIQNVQGRQSQGYAGNAGKNQASGARVVNPVGNKREKDSEWFKEKMLLAQAQEAGVVLNDEQHDFLADDDIK
ncbi:hypothetical protein Tco_0801335 [Tanacetum coccineum]|uniref:Uncharacterized protein n=1 Tax=Tanacetum coccineum TaxID=301880 RepID=A0ABQ4ZWI8_9ASTR